MAMTVRLALKQCSSCFSVATKSSAGQVWRSFTTSSTPLLFRATLPLDAEPMKRRKKMDINIIVQRELKKRKKIEKQIKKLELKGRQLKPIDEIEGDRSFLKTLDKRKRETTPATFEESEQRAALVKTWARYKRDEFVVEMNDILRVQRSQQKALDELRKESEELYQLAIELDEKLIPFEMKGPVETPPIKGYAAPDGDYIDTTKKFDK